MRSLIYFSGASYTIDAEEGMAYITGRANPRKLLRKLQSGKYANLCWVSAGNQITYGNAYHEGMQMQSPYAYNTRQLQPPGYWHDHHYDHPMLHYYPQPRHTMAAYPYHHDYHHWL